MAPQHPSATRTSIRSRLPGLREAVLAGVLGLAILAACALWAWSWRDQLPDTVATHWGSDGADSFSSPTSAILTGVGIGATLTVFLAAVTAWSGRSTLYRRLLVGLTVGAPTLAGSAMLAFLHAQIGLTDARAVDDLGGSAAVVGFAAGIVAGGLAALLVRPVEVSPTSAPTGAVARVPLAPGERAAWSRRVTGRSPAIVTGAASVVLVASAALTASPALLLLAVVPILFLVAFVSWHVGVDARGLRVRSLLGVPRVRVAASDVTRAEPVDVHPVRDFGGWGWRAGRDGATGIVVRGGEALRVERSDGRVLVVTVDDAEAGAALLNTMAERARSTR